jgi:hypothetical protein
MRMSMISTMLKEKRTVLYGLFITLGGVFNIAVCILGARQLPASNIPLLTLSGDVFLSVILVIYFIANKRIRF